MPQHNSLPTPADIAVLLASLDQPITLPSGFDVDSELDGVIDDWEEFTNYRPFYQPSASVATHYFDPPGPNNTGMTRGSSCTLSLHNGLLSLDSLYVGVITADNSPGTQLILGKDFWLWPGNAQANPLKVQPYTHIEFSYPQRGAPQSIAVTGVWGYCNAANGVPDMAWKGIRDLAAAACLESLLLYVTQGPTEAREDDVMEKYDADAIRSIISFIARRGMAARARYKLYP